MLKTDYSARTIGFVSIFFLLLSGAVQSQNRDTLYIRTNQLGYLPDDAKVAIAFSQTPNPDLKFELVDPATNATVWGPQEAGGSAGSYGNFEYHYRLDFSSFRGEGNFRIEITGTPYLSRSFSVGREVYGGMPDEILKYIRKQRCGYNPFLDQVCHRKDGRSMYGPMPDSTFIDASGGWHDAADYLRYMLTSGNTTGRLLFTYRETEDKSVFADRHNALGQPRPNDIPDILDEAKWGLDWMLKMHPVPEQLFHQVADDRDHIGFKLPYADSSDYGWGPDNYRVVYYANGKPQGLGKYKNTSTGVANIAGRYTAVMALAADIWENDLNKKGRARQYLKAGKEVYELGREKPGSQEGTPHLASYRYHEITWADDMEWGAAELFKMTGEKRYLKEAKSYARKINTISWMGKDTARHYEYYPFMNLGHYALYPLVENSFQDTLASYYRKGLEDLRRRALRNPYRIGYPFIWCSNNLASALITQALLYERMTGDDTYRPMALEVRDWLLGRNPWGVSQFIGIPSDGVTPQDPHDSIAYLTGREVTGGLLDGPLYTETHRKHHIGLFEPDEYTEFQSDLVVYHDDLGDYSTNEPTLDGTAETLFWMALFAAD